MNFNLNSYLKQLDSMFQKTKKNIESRIKKRQAGEEDLGITRTKLTALKFELSRMEQNMRKYTEKEFKGLKESMAASNMLKSKNMSDVAQVVLKGNSHKIKKYLNRMSSPKMNNALKAIKKADPKLHSKIVDEEGLNEKSIDAVKKAKMNVAIKTKQLANKRYLDRLKARKSRIKTEKTMKSGDKLSGKKEPIDLQPELKTDNR